MIFRSDFYAKKPVGISTEHDHRHISRIIGHCWKKLPDSLRDMYKERAKEEAEEHKKKYPNYRFRPVHRTTPPQRRMVKRNGLIDRIRCEEIALMIGRGLSGDELHKATKALDTQLKEEFEARARAKRAQAQPPAFRSPLMAPTTPSSVQDVRMVMTSPTLSAYLPPHSPSSFTRL